MLCYSCFCFYQCILLYCSLLLHSCKCVSNKLTYLRAYEHDNHIVTALEHLLSLGDKTFSN